jgi:uncharacterized protein (TIGR00369 family)
MSAPELEAFLQAQFPALDLLIFRIERIETMAVQVRMVYHDRHLRPGGTISGPSLMTLADVATYLAILAMVGPLALAVTTNLNINFLRKPAPANIIAEARLLALDHQLAVGEVAMRSDGSPALVAFATVTYALPRG